MKRSVFLGVTVIVIVFICFYSSDALGTFSIKSKNTYYGRNWDYDIERKKDAVITMCDTGNGMSRIDFTLKDSEFMISSINSEGFYVACYENQSCALRPETNTDTNAIDMYELRTRSVNFKSISELKNYISDKQIYCYKYPEHVFYSDIMLNCKL